MVQVWLRCKISVLLPSSDWFWMAALISGAQLRGYLEFPLKVGSLLCLSLMGESQQHKSEQFGCAPVWICCPKKSWHFSCHFCPCFFPSSGTGLYFAAAESLTSNFLQPPDPGNLWKTALKCVKIFLEVLLGFIMHRPCSSPISPQDALPWLIKLKPRFSFNGIIFPDCYLTKIPFPPWNIDSVRLPHAHPLKTSRSQPLSLQLVRFFFRLFQ